MSTTSNRNNIIILPEEINYSFIRSSGPGGQNVNKVATAVQIQFNAKLNYIKSDEDFEKLKKICGKKLSTDGVITIEAKRYRTQESNKKDALNRLKKILTKFSARIRIRKQTKPNKTSVEKRLNEKRKQSEKKKFRKNNYD